MKQSLLREFCAFCSFDELYTNVLNERFTRRRTLRGAARLRYVVFAVNVVPNNA